MLFYLDHSNHRSTSTNLYINFCLSFQPQRYAAISHSPLISLLITITSPITTEQQTTNNLRSLQQQQFEIEQMSTTHANVPYPGATSPRQCMDIYLPNGSNSDTPLLVYVHGKSSNQRPR
jgi:acetyl esterase/lipase